MNHALEMRLAASLGFATDHIGRLDDYAAHWRGADDAVIRLQDKVVTEAALLLLLARRVESGGLRAANAALARAIMPHIRSSRLYALLVRQPQTAATLGAGHVFLTAAGWPDADFDEPVWSALDSGFGETVERINYRLLDQRWTRNLVARERLDFEALAPASILASRAHPFYMTTADAYAVTHAIMYLTDFGQQALPGSLDERHIAAMVADGIAWHLLSEDFDLLVEYLICAECLGMGGRPVAVLGWHVVDRLWRDLAFLPGPTFDPARYRTLEATAAAAYAFEHMYHTNFVAGMYLAIRAAWPRQLDAILVDSAEDVARIEALLAVILGIAGTSASPRSPWFAALDDAPVSDGAIATILWDAAAIEAARRDDRAAMARLAILEQPDSATARELAWLQERIMRFEQPIAQSRAA